jgi:hypothetical protein
VPGSNSGKESGTISRKILVESLGKKSGKDLPDQVKLCWGGWAGQKCARQGDFFASGKRPFCTQEHQVYTKPFQQGDEVESESDKRVNPSWMQRSKGVWAKEKF